MSDGRDEDAALAAERIDAADRSDGPGGDPDIPFLTQEEIDALVAAEEDDDV